MFTKAALAALAAAALVLPAAASAQSYYAQSYYAQGYYGQGYYGQGYAQPAYPQDYGPPRGDGYGRQGRFPSYPEFRGIEQHIRQEIRDAVRDDMIEPDDARDLFGQLRDIQMQEAREFRVHGWNLPDEDRDQLRSEFDRLDQLVDQIRDEP